MNRRFIMATNLKDKATEAGHVVADAAKSAGHKIAEGAEKAVKFVKEQTGIGGPGACDPAKMAQASVQAPVIREHLEVVGSCGKLVGRVDKVEGISIKLTKDSTQADGEHRYIPTAWVESVDTKVHLNKPCGDVQEQWQAHPVREEDYVSEPK